MVAPGRTGSDRGLNPVELHTAWGSKLNRYRHIQQIMFYCWGTSRTSWRPGHRVHITPVAPQEELYGRPYGRQLHGDRLSRAKAARSPRSTACKDPQGRHLRWMLLPVCRLHIWKQLECSYAIQFSTCYSFLRLTWHIHMFRMKQLVNISADRVALCVIKSQTCLQDWSFCVFTALMLRKNRWVVRVLGIWPIMDQQQRNAKMKVIDQWFVDQSQCYMFATRDIGVNEEICYDYGAKVPWQIKVYLMSVMLINLINNWSVVTFLLCSQFVLTSLVITVNFFTQPSAFLHCKWPNHWVCCCILLVQ